VDPQRGLQVRTTADGNLATSSEPKLVVTTPAYTFSIVTLPANGVLRDSNNAILTSPSVLTNQIVRYTPDFGFVNDVDQFDFRVEDEFGNFAIATIFIHVHALVTCPDGRGC
jgi:hypothetical protein